MPTTQRGPRDPALGSVPGVMALANPPQRRRVGWLLTIVVIGVALALRWTHATQWSFADLADFVQGGRSVLTGRQVYDDIPGVLPFNYPPFGAVVMVPLALVGLGASEVLLTLVSLACYAVVVVVIARRLGLRPLATGAVGLGGLALEPITRHLVLGQINLVLMLLVVVDLYVVPRRYRGLLIGIAAGIKLTPVVFVVQLLLRREWSSALRSVAALAGTVALGWALAPSSSARYWLEDLDKTRRFGADAIMDANQSVRAVVVRALGTEQPPPFLWGTLSILALLACVWVAARVLRRGDDVGSMLALAVGGLLASPISWSHHWVWVVPAILYAVARGHRWVGWSLAVVFFVAPMWFLPAGDGAELGYGPVQLAVSASYVLVGVAGLVLLATRSRAGMDTGAIDQQP